MEASIMNNLCKGLADGLEKDLKSVQVKAILRTAVDHYVILHFTVDYK